MYVAEQIDPEGLASILRTALHSPPRSLRALPSSNEQGTTQSRQLTSLVLPTPPQLRCATKADDWLTHVREDQLDTEQLNYIPPYLSTSTVDVTRSYTLDSLIAIAQVVVYEDELICQRVLRSAEQNCLYSPAALHALLHLSLKKHIF